MKNVFKKAHEITKNIIRKDDSYRETFRLALIFVYSETKKGENKMIEYTTKKGTNVKIELENAVVKNLIVNDIEIVKDRTKRDMSVFITSFDNTIVLNSSRLYGKLGANQIIRIMASDELMEEYHKQYKEILKSQEEERNRILNRTNKKTYYDYDIHMNDINADLMGV